MKTTLIFDDDAAQEAPRKSKRYRIRPASPGGPRPGIDLDKVLQLADALENESSSCKLDPPG